MLFNMMEIWIPIEVDPSRVQEEIQNWLDKYSYHAYRSIVQDRINSCYPRFNTPSALYIMKIESRQVVGIEPHEQSVGLPALRKVLCPICHEEDTVVRQTLSCNHTFHHHCIQQWFRVNNTCPLCRVTIF